MSYILLLPRDDAFICYRQLLFRKIFLVFEYCSKTLLRHEDKQRKDLAEKRRRSKLILFLYFSASFLLLESFSVAMFPISKEIHFGQFFLFFFVANLIKDAAIVNYYCRVELTVKFMG